MGNIQTVQYFQKTCLTDDKKQFSSSELPNYPSKRCYGARYDNISKENPLPPPAFQHGKKQFNFPHILEISSLYLCAKDKVPECLLGFFCGKAKARGERRDEQVKM